MKEKRDTSGYDEVSSFEELLPAADGNENVRW